LACHKDLKAPKKRQPPIRIDLVKVIEQGTTAGHRDRLLQAEKFINGLLSLYRLTGAG
jgi:hypothetical protein